MKGLLQRSLILAVFLLCLTSPSMAYKYKDLFEGKSPKAGEALKKIVLDPELEKRILALDPENISASDVENTLMKAPAPQILGIHGGIYPVYLCMISFGEFLIRMGYPERSVLQPGNGYFSYSCYFDAKPMVGAIAWHYERDAMRPMMIGHSQGGIQTPKVLHELAGHFSKSVPVWSPLTSRTEKRDTILDPFTGETRPVIGLSASYASAVGAGGLTRLLPNQWVMNAGLRIVPDSVADFTGFALEGDFLGGDLMGVSGSNRYTAQKKAEVHNVLLGFGTDHVTVPNTKHLALNPETRKWLNEFHPSKNPNPPHLKGPTANLMWAANVWYSIKKHWCLELQNLVRHKQKDGPVEIVVPPAPPRIRRHLLGRSWTARLAS